MRRRAAWVAGLLGLGALFAGLARAEAPGEPSAGQSPAGQEASPAPALSGARFQALFQEANQLYLGGDYAGAAAAYRKLLDAGMQHPDLYFNLGNAHARAGAKGLAVLFYERALRLDPHDTAVRSNLESVKKELIDRVVMPGTEGGVGEPLWHEFIRGLGLDRLTWLGLGLYWLFFGLLIARALLGMVRDGALRRLLFWLNVPVLGLLLAVGGLTASRIWIEERVHHAIVVEQAAPLREGPERTAKALMQVHEGLKVRLLSQVGEFARVRLENGVEGFLAEGHIGRI
jgi:tetratricopeptide (TPR) repeat protein